MQDDPKINKYQYEETFRQVMGKIGFTDYIENYNYTKKNEKKFHTIFKNFTKKYKEIIKPDDGKIKRIYEKCYFYLIQTKFLGDDLKNLLISLKAMSNSYDLDYEFIEKLTIKFRLKLAKYSRFFLEFKTNFTVLTKAVNKKNLDNSKTR